MYLSQLLAPYISISPNDDREVTNLCLSSRDVKPGALFFAYPGEKADGRNYIQDAIKNGAVAVVAESTGQAQGAAPTSTVIYLNDIQSKIGPIAQKFYDYPAKKMKIIGVTGTNGKTSVTYILAQIFNLWGISAVSMGTFGIGKPGEKFIETGINTPDPVSLQRYFSELTQQGCKVVAMEVSSHGLAQDRVRGIDFEAAIFTNLTQDHLDYHHTMHEYGLAKERFLTHHGVKKAIFNLDDAWCANLYQKYKNEKLSCFAYSLKTPMIDLKDTQFIGQFNLQNILAAVTCLISLGYDEASVLSTLAKVRPVPGRLELLQLPGMPSCVIDYAHTPDALQKALLAVREMTQGKLYCIFGCGGDRDTSKRPLMAAIAEKFADAVCITDDNPRNEASEKILEDIMTGFSAKADFVVIADREAAIRETILRAKENDTVLIAGKGHEDYQIVKDKKHFFSDQLVVKKVFGLKGF